MSRVLEGIEASRRAAWAKYYNALRELNAWRSPDCGVASVVIDCPCCDVALYCELVPDTARDGGLSVVTGPIRLDEVTG